MKTKLLIVTTLCSLQCSILIGMDNFKKDLNDLKSGKNNSIKTEDLAKRAAELSRGNKKNYYAISQLVHPDKAGIELEDIFKAANNAYNNKKITQAEETPAEKKARKIREKIQQQKTDIDFLNSATNQILANGYYKSTNIKHSMIEKVVQSLFSILASKITPDYLKNKETESVTAEYKSYRLDLEKETNNNYNEARNRLNQYLKKDN